MNETDGVIENWVDQKFKILDQNPPYYTAKGVIFVNNPEEYRVAETNYLGSRIGSTIKSERLSKISKSSREVSSSLYPARN